jgi:hypothetical protein
MKAKPVTLRNGHPVERPIEEATHVIINLPGPVGKLMLPVLPTAHGWDWNRNATAPTLQPSILTKGSVEGGEPFVCHCYVTDGKVQFLGDCTHEFVNQTIDLHDVH